MTYIVQGEIHTKAKVYTGGSELTAEDVKALGEEEIASLIENGALKIIGNVPAQADGDDGEDGLGSKTVKELKAMATELGLEFANNATKAQLIDLIEEAQNDEGDEQ